MVSKGHEVWSRHQAVTQDGRIAMEAILNTMRRIDAWLTPRRMAVIILAILLLAGGRWAQQQNLVGPAPIEVEDDERLATIA